MNSALRFALFGNVFQRQKSASVTRLLSLLEARDAKILMDRRFHHFLTTEAGVKLHDVELIDDDQFAADVVVSLGGDGTFLEVVRRVGRKQIPILGINMGRLGFLSDFTSDEMEQAIDDIYEGRIRTEERSLLSVTYSEGAPTGHPFALNEVAVLKHNISSMISIRVEIDGEYLTTYQADGLIVNTPTGSTGYALSVGGPIIWPSSHTIGLVPVAPHSLNVRPLMVSDSQHISLSVESRSHNFLVSIDGRSEKCNENIRIDICRAPYTIQVLKRPGSSFFHTLRSKLMWGNDLRETKT